MHLSFRRGSRVIGRRKALLIWGGAAVLLCCWFSASDTSSGQPIMRRQMMPISQDICTRSAPASRTQCSRVLIDDNQHVVEGQTLVILDPNDYKVRLDQAQAALDAAGRQVQTADAAIHTTSQSATAQTTQAQGAIGEAKASIQASKAAVIAAEAGVPRAEAQLQQANATLATRRNRPAPIPRPVCERAGFETNPRSPARELSGGGSWAGSRTGTGTAGRGAD